MTIQNKMTKHITLMQSIYKQMKNIAAAGLLFASATMSIQAQEVTYSKPSWWVGGAGGANFNFYNGSTQKLDNNLTIPSAFHKGNGIGLYLAPSIEYYRPGTRWGIMVQLGYDSRRGSFDQTITPCNCPATVKTNLSYLTLEPSVKFVPFKTGFYLYGGPRFAVNFAKDYTYSQGTNPNYPDQPKNPDMKGEFSDVEQVLISMQVGAGYDIPVSGARQTQWVLSPFVAFHPYFGQSPRNIETWNVTTLRAGLAIKVGRGHKINPSSKEDMPVAAVVPKATFMVNAPKNIPVERRVRETFPLRNYIFFDLGSTEIPDRYVLLEKNQVKDFNENQLEVFKPKKLSGRSERQMIVYYNVINILGSRMQKDPSSTITLVGSSDKDPDDGTKMAESVKTYLVDVFGIKASRITTTGRSKPKLPSGQPGATTELDLLAEGNRRVSVESSSPGLLMEFQSGPDAPLKPVEIIAVQEAPPDSYVSFDLGSSNENYTSWSMEIKDDKGAIQTFGPYTRQTVSIPGKSIMGTRPEGNYNITMVGNLRDGNVLRKDTTVHLVLWTPSKNEEGMRFSVLYEFNDSKAIGMYEKYLTEIVTPKIPKNATVIIHGYSDIIGDESHNLRLSQARGYDVRDILEKSLTKAGRKDVKFEVYGYGEDESLVPFQNKYPEQRFYNRTVVIDIIPHE